MDWALIGQSILVAFVSFVRSLGQDVDPVELGNRAKRYLDENRKDLLAAEDREREILGR